MEGPPEEVPEAATDFFPTSLEPPWKDA